MLFNRSCTKKLLSYHRNELIILIVGLHDTEYVTKEDDGIHKTELGLCHDELIKVDVSLICHPSLWWHNDSWIISNVGSSLVKSWPHPIFRN